LAGEERREKKAKQVDRPDRHVCRGARHAQNLKIEHAKEGATLVLDGKEERVIGKKKGEKY
jgi:hypothetical protein